MLSQTFINHWFYGIFDPFFTENFRKILGNESGVGLTSLGQLSQILPGIFSIYFYDPNDIRLEACCEPQKGDDQLVVKSVTQTKAVAMEELRTLSDDENWLKNITKNLS